MVVSFLMKWFNCSKCVIIEFIEYVKKYNICDVNVYILFDMILMLKCVDWLFWNKLYLECIYIFILYLMGVILFLFCIYSWGWGYCLEDEFVKYWDMDYDYLVLLFGIMYDVDY